MTWSANAVRFGEAQTAGIQGPTGPWRVGAEGRSPSAVPLPYRRPFFALIAALPDLL